MKTYPTKTQATKAKKFGQTVRKRRDGMWVCEKPKVKVGKGRTTINIQAVDTESVSNRATSKPTLTIPDNPCFIP